MSIKLDSILKNRYRLDEELGAGGGYVVYRARDLVLDRDVAIKVLTSPALGGKARQMLLREAQAIGRLNHPNIVSIFDAGEDLGFPFYVMEMVESDLSVRERASGDVDEALAMARQICAALEYAHAHGIFHLDLKPVNMILGLDGSLKLTDFLMSFIVAAQVGAEAHVPYFSPHQAPEVCLRQEVDARADLYSLGVMLYEWVVGELPYAANEVTEGSTPWDVPVVPPRARNPGIAPELDGLIVRLLAKAPDDRPSSASEVLGILRGLDRRAVERGRLARELQMAHNLQASLLPHEAPRCAGWEFATRWQPAHKVAGDYYDFVPLEEGHIGLVIADVSDKGMAAALFMSLTRTIVRASVSHAPWPAEGISHANHLISADSTSGMFVTLFYGLLDPQTGAITYVNAGHNPPLYYNAGRDELRHLKPTGMALGIVADAPFEQRQVRLHPQDWIFLYTDGVPDATDAEGTRFGIDRLQQVLLDHSAESAEGLAAALESALSSHIGDAPAFDDIAWILVGRLAG